MGTVFSSSEEEKEEEEEEELEQEPEGSSFEHSLSPLSPQISMSRSPFFGPSMKNSDPYNAITPVSLSPSGSTPPVSSHLSRFHHNLSTSISSPGPFLPSWLLTSQEFQIEVYLIRHAQSTGNIRPELIGGRSPSGTLTEKGRHEAKVLGAFLSSSGVVFDAMYCSPLERAKQTAETVCQVVGFPEERVEFVEALQELSQGQWEGRLRTEVYTREILQLMNNTVPDFRAPGGESQRQVEFRMVEFLNNILLPHGAIALQEEAKLGKDKETVLHNPATPIQSHEVHEITAVDEPPLLESSKGPGKGVMELEHKSINNGYDLFQPENGVHDHGSRRGRLAKIFVRSELESLQSTVAYRVAVFSHGVAIKCALKGLLGSDPHMTNKICIDNTSVTLLNHSGSTGWQVKRVNDTAHLRLL